MGLLAGLLFLAGCTTASSPGAFDAGFGAVALRQTHSGGYDLAQGSRWSVALPGYRQARLIGLWTAGTSTVVVVGGSDEACPLRYTVVSARAQAAEAHRLPGCGAYDFSGDGASVTATQEGGRDPMVWTFRDGALTGPTPRSALLRRASARSAARSGAAGKPDADPYRTPPPISQEAGEDVIPAAVDPRAERASAPVVNLN
jgi:hypothetical protein